MIRRFGIASAGASRRLLAPVPNEKGAGFRRLPLLALLTAALIAACVTPVIPLPPPKIGDLVLAVSDPTRDLVTIAGKPNPQYRGMLVYVLNLTVGRGVIVETSYDDGSFVTDPFVAREGDRIDIWIQRGPGEDRSSVLQTIVSGGQLAQAP